VKSPRGPAAVSGDEGCKKATGAIAWKAQPEDDPRARRPAQVVSPNATLRGSREIGANTLISQQRFPRKKGGSRKGGGFTLIELLVSMAIILILIAVALPNYLSAQERARTVLCKSNLRALGQGLLQYKLDYNAFPPADGCAGEEPSQGRTCVGGGPAALGSWDGAPWILNELGYVPDREAFYCPVMAGLFPEEKEKVRYAYNSSAVDTGGANGGANHLDRDSGHLWLCRCAWLPASASFDPHSGLKYPHGNDLETGEEDVMENVLRINSVVEAVNGLAEFNQSTRGFR